MSEGAWFLEWHEGGLSRRAVIRTPLVIGRSRSADIVVRDPYISRQHCVVGVSDGRAFVDARQSLNRLVVDGREVEVASLQAGSSFVLGQTVFRVWGPDDDEDMTTRRLLSGRSPVLVLRKSTRELVDHEGTLIARFSPSEFGAFLVLVAAYPDAADYAQLGRGVWGTTGFDLYQLHRLLQRVRQRMGSSGGLLENVRGLGYRLTSAIRVI